MVVNVVKINNRSVKVYANFSDAKKFVENVLDTTKKVEICVIPVEDCFDPKSTILDRNLSVQRGRYTVIDYQYTMAA